MKHGIIAAIAAVTAILMGLFVRVQLLLPQKEVLPEQTFGLFSWDDWVIQQDEIEALAFCIQKAGVKEIYQEFSLNELKEGAPVRFVTRMNEAAVDVYALAGAAEWALEGNDGLLETVQVVAKYNQKQEKSARIAGIMVDVEPHILSGWDWSDDRLVEGYLNNLSDAYAYADMCGLEFLVCITNGYDEYCPDTLERILIRTCDGIAIMNYDRTDEYGQIKDEVFLAQEYRRRVICIYELQKPGYHELEKINTYAQEGLAALWESANLLKQQFEPFDLEFAYHYYAPLKEMLGME